MPEKPDQIQNARELLAVALSGGDIADAHHEVLQVCEAYLSAEPARRAPFYVPMAFIVLCMGLGVVLASAAAGIAFYRLNQVQQSCEATEADDGR